MEILEITPKEPGPPPPPPKQESGYLFEADKWEEAYRHDVPALLVQMQDDLSRSRQREAFWISVVVHILVVIFVWNLPALGRLLPRNVVVALSPADLLRQKDATFLALPSDAQKVTKRPNTDKISDKDRIATSRAPHLDPKELKQILDAARAGAPGMNTPPQQAQAASPGSQAETPQPQQQQADQTPPRPTLPNQEARLQPPPSFNTGNLSAGSAIEQAARAAAANRRQSFGGDGGDYGLGQGRQPTQAVGAMDVLSDTMGVDFGPYLKRVLHDVQENWYRIIPDSARAPMMKKGKVSIEFVILKDGRVAGMTLAGTSGDVALDRASWGGITGSNPFPPLPREFGGQYLALRFHFFYNPDKNELQ